MKRIIVIAALGISLCLSAQSERMICDETCKIESSATAGEAAKPTAKEAGYSVVSPVGRASVKIIEQAPRL